jgi:hypothetical protein
MKRLELIREGVRSRGERSKGFLRASDRLIRNTLDALAVAGRSRARLSTRRDYEGAAIGGRNAYPILRFPLFNSLRPGRSAAPSPQNGRPERMP